MEQLSPQQIEFLKYYLDPESETFSNATQSAIKAGYSQDYADNLTSLMPNWLSESIGRRKKLLNKAEKNLETLSDSKDERVKADITKFICKTIGKNEGYSDRQEITGKDGRDLQPQQLLVKFINGNKANNNGDTTGISEAI